MANKLRIALFFSLVIASTGVAQNGGVDFTFNGSGMVTTALSVQGDMANGSVLQSDGKIIIVGYASNGTDYDFAIARYNSNGSLDNTFNGNGKLIIAVGSGYDEARGVAVQSDGKIVVAGYSWNGSNSDFAVVRLNSDGTLDETFSDDGIVTTDIDGGYDEAYGLAIQSDGKIVVVGYGDNGSNSDFAVARYNTDGTLDNTFSDDGIVTSAIGSDSDEAKSIAIQTNGMIVVAGYSHNGADGDVAVARYDTDGILDNAFGTGGIVVTNIDSRYEEAYTLAIQTDGKIVVAGYTDTESNAYDGFILRYTSAGVLDNTFGSDGKVITTLSVYDDPIRSIAIQSDGKIVAAGGTTVESNGVMAVHRYNTNGSLDNTFGTNGIVTTSVNLDGNEANSVVIQTDGKIVVSGYTSISGSYDVALVRYVGEVGPGDFDITLNGTGKAMTSIGSGSSGIRSVALQTDGKIVAAGYGSNGSDGDFAIARYNSNGTLDNTFNSNGKVMTAVGASTDEANGVAIQPDGKIVVAGYSWNGSNSDFAVLRYNSNGSLDNTFGGDGIVTTDINSDDNEAYGVAVQPDEKIVVVGYAKNGSSYEFAVVRYNSDGTLDNTFSGDGIATTAVGSSDDEGKSVVIQPDGKIVVGGLSHNGVDGDAAIVRYNSDGTLDTSFDSDGKVVLDIAGEYEEIYGIALQADGKILATGYTSNGSSYDLFVLRYTSAGVLDNSFDTDGKVVTSLSSYDDVGQNIAVQSDGKFIIAGYTSNDNDQEIALLRFLNNGALDNSIGSNGVVITGSVSGQNDYAAAVVIQPDGNIVVAGTGYDGSNDNFSLFRFVGDTGPLTVLSYSSSIFSEAESNVGAIDNGSPITIMLSGDTFTGSNSDNFFSAGKISVGNLPSGLTAVATRTSATTLAVTLTGVASGHAAANSIANLTFTFQNSAFNSGSATNVVNATKSNLHITFTDPAPNNALTFDGSDDVISVPASSSINLSHGTWEAWVKVNTLAHHHRIIFKEGADFSGKYELYILDNGFGGSIRADIVVDDTRYNAIAGSGITIGTWTHIAATFDSMDFKLYVNGTLSSTTSVSEVPVAIDANTGPLGIGGNVSGSASSYFEGAIDEVRIWNIVRTEEEIAADMNTMSLSPSTTGLVALYHFDQGTAGGTNTSITTLFDATANANNGTLNNFALTGSSSNFISNDNPLPAEIVSFTAFAHNTAVELQWTTATEANNYGFEVERSVLGQSEPRRGEESRLWNKIGFVEGNGTTNTPKEYSFIDKNLSAEKYSYRLKHIDRDGKFEYSQAVEITVGNIPKVFSLEQNYPNPFNPSTTIGFTLEKSGMTTLKIYDAIGREVETLVHENLEAGVYHQKRFDASKLSSGIYIARLSSSTKTQVKKLMLMK